ncbi:MAG: hypothetical protein IPG12_04860 [Saprospiraceae bacterium]|nr:hypothetical protein [Saprospiraceae bacterium]
MANNLQDNNFKKAKATILAFFQTLSELISILSYLVFNVVFVILFFLAIRYHLFSNFEPEVFIKKALTSFELLFVAPIPILIVFAFKAIMVRIYPSYFNEPEDDPKNLLKLDLAKKTFISSIIGVLATFILGIFLSQTTFDLWSIYKILLFMVFLLILIIYYKILSDHSKD